MLIKILLEWSAKDLEMLQANIAFRLQHTNFSVLRLIPRPGNHTTLSFKIHNYNSKFKIKIYNLKSKFEIQSKFEIPIQNPKFKIYDRVHTNCELQFTISDVLPHFFPSVSYACDEKVQC